MKLFQHRKADIIGAGLAVFLGVALITMNHTIRPRREGRICQSNLKRLGISYQQYVRDHDERFPLANNWVTALYPYSKSTAVLRCPARRDLVPGYAMNRRIAGAKLSDVSAPKDTILGFDSDAGTANPCDFGISLPDVPRHRPGHAILFADAHVAAVVKPDFARGFDPAMIEKVRAKNRQRELLRMRQYNKAYQHWRKGR